MLKFIVNFTTMNKIISLLLLACLFSCQPKRSIDALDWMEGRWEIPSDSVTQRIEQWTKISQTEMHGFGLTIEGGDTIFYERLSIVASGTELYFNADIGEGNVKFKLIDAANERWIFENANHDFPKRIIYQKEGEMMVAFAEVEGTSLKFRFIKLD